METISQTSLCHWCLWKFDGTTFI